MRIEPAKRGDIINKTRSLISPGRRNPALRELLRKRVCPNMIRSTCNANAICSARNSCEICVCAQT